MDPSFLRSGSTCGRPGPAEPGRKPQGEGGADSAASGSGGALGGRRRRPVALGGDDAVEWPGPGRWRGQREAHVSPRIRAVVESAVLEAGGGR